MRTYAITEYDKQDYDDYENNVTLAEIINNLKFINRGYIPDYDFTGEEDDFERFKLHTSLHKAIKILENEKDRQEERRRNMTQYERIKNMSIDEMAEFIHELVTICNTTECEDCKYCDTSMCMSCKMTKEWLESEVKE